MCGEKHLENLQASGVNDIRFKSKKKYTIMTQDHENGVTPILIKWL